MILALKANLISHCKMQVDMMILPTADHVLAMSEIENAKGFFKALPYFSDAMRADYP